MFLVLAAMLLLPGLAMAGREGPASFVVDFGFSDGNNLDTSVARISCTGGLPLTSQQDVQHDSTITFVLDFPDEGAGTSDCDIWVDDVSGYTANYIASGDSGNVEDSAGCHFFNVDFADENFCEVIMSTDPASMTVHKTWDVNRVVDFEVDRLSARLKVCGNRGVVVGGLFDISTDQFCVDKLVLGPGNGSLTAVINSDHRGEDVFVYESILDSAVESDMSDCVRSPQAHGVDFGGFSREIFNGDHRACTIENTVFFEGIPTLNQYGLAIMALLMLGVGFVGFRRFV